MQVTAAAHLLDALRLGTALEHQSLEKALDLLTPPLEQDRFARLLERFYGFHAAFEPEALKCGVWGGFVDGRRKLGKLTVDLAALGRPADAVSALPWCEPARDLTRSPEILLGALYVLEGSVLGGQVVSRALARAPWAPAGGLSYFQPYGSMAGEMWRGFRAAAAAASRPAADPATVAAARRTFVLLIDWLQPAFRQAA